MQSSALRLTQTGLAVAGALSAAYPLLAADTDLASEPLATAASSVRPNIMFILDDSGSMEWDYTPDYVDDETPSSLSTTSACYDGGDSRNSSTNNDYDNAAGNITGRPDACQVGDPPYMSPDFNTQYYNPAIYYRPGINADGTEKNPMNATNTSNWTAVITDPYGVQRQNQLGTSVSTVDLTTQYPDRVWCRNTGDAVGSANCLTNTGGYQYPDDFFKYNLNGLAGNTGVGRKYQGGAPYYWRMKSAMWCSNSALTTGAKNGAGDYANCKSGSAVDPSVHIYIAPEFCSDAELTSCEVGSAVTSSHIHSGVRWCSDAGTLKTCQRKKLGAFKHAKHLGATVFAAGATPAVQATGTLTVNAVTVGGSVTDIKVGATTIATGITAASGATTTSFAAAVATAINGGSGTHNHTATSSGNVVTVRAPSPGGVNTNAITATVGAATGIAPQSSVNLVVNRASAGSAGLNQITSIKVNNGSSDVELISASQTATYTLGSGGSLATATVSAGKITIAGGTRNPNPNSRNVMRNAIVGAINYNTATSGFSAAAGAGDGAYTVYAAIGINCGVNGKPFDLSGTNLSNFTEGNFAGGGCNSVSISNGVMSGGQDASTGNFDRRIGIGQFERINIVSTVTAYSKDTNRIDCAGSTCTYAEEMTNFANWYAYYRTRMQMMKSAAGRAFGPMDDTYRVGFITINPGAGTSSVQSSRYLKISEFNTTHKSSWYTKFYSTAPSGGTPLREALSRVGRLYAGQFDGINNGIPSADDPVQYSCQPNFAILSTDGYWTTVGSTFETGANIGRDISNSSLGQQDSVDSGYSKRTDGAFDGNPSGNVVGVADVALYYYKTDLRPSMTDNVPQTQKDSVSHQHMTTFTLGLGLDGTLSYRRDYETATSGDFWDIKQGTKNWPVPKADSPEALDDLWHAAVNGRGVFFSARDPQELAAGLQDTLSALQTRIGAGAAAATSNLQPVAGDNFAFTAQYQTADWVGDLKARTIDLNSGIVSAIELWSAQAKLDQRDFLTRKLLIPDLADAAGDKLKSFCWPGDTSLGCGNGSGLSAAEQAYFNPNRLVQYGNGNWDAAQKAFATAEMVVTYLRGDTGYEDTGGGGTNDLFRNRLALLGDIVNAQPAYVKSSPFNYADTGYTDYKKCTLGTTEIACPSTQFPAPTVARQGTVYVASNDGMLHAIETDVNNNPYYQTGGIGTTITSDDTFTGNNTGNGEERWAFIPSMVLPEIYKLGNRPYNHSYFVDGSPVVGDVCLSTPCAGLADWRTILVAGLNKGGRGFYALDVTNPAAPKLLWEFKVRKPSVTACAATTAAAVGASDDCDLGYSYGNPIITKRKSDGRWVVIVTSGYNNTGLEAATTNRQGDGKGYLYVLDAAAGTILHKIGTGVGDPGTAGASYADADPSGLGRINAWVDDGSTDNTALAVYGGDLKGNLWRFDLDSSSAGYLTAFKLADLKDASNVAQPITVKPELGLVTGNYRAVFLGTGKFLGVSDKSTTTPQSIYAIRDDLSTTPVAIRGDLVQQTLGAGAVPNERTVTSTAAVDWSVKKGWYIDLPDTGERVSVDPQLQLGTLVVASNVPSGDTCTAGGFAWQNFLDYKTGRVIAGSTNNMASTKIAASLVVGLNVIQLPGGKVVTIITTADNQQLTVETPVAPTTFAGQRISWRELIVE